MTIFIFINIIAAIIFGLIGLVYLINNKKDVPKLIQLSINKQTLFNFTLLMTISGLIMLIAFIINLKMGLIEIENKRNIITLIKGIPIDLINAICEEFMIRVVLFIGLLAVWNNKIFALIISSIIFCCLHSPDSIITTISYFLAGLMYGITFLHFKNIWAPIGLHFGWNYFQGNIFGFPVSSQTPGGFFQLKITNNVFWNGGDIGVEGSIYGIIGRILIILSIILITHIFSTRINHKHFLEIIPFYNKNR